MRECFVHGACLCACVVHVVFVCAILRFTPCHFCSWGRHCTHMLLHGLEAPALADVQQLLHLLRWHLARHVQEQLSAGQQPGTTPKLAHCNRWPQQLMAAESIPSFAKGAFLRITYVCVCGLRTSFLCVCVCMLHIQKCVYMHVFLCKTCGATILLQIPLLLHCTGTSD